MERREGQGHQPRVRTGLSQPRGHTGHVNKNESNLFHRNVSILQQLLIPHPILLMRLSGFFHLFGQRREFVGHFIQPARKLETLMCERVM